MNKFIIGKTEGKTLDDMTLVFNRTQTPKIATEEGHMIGGQEQAWVNAADRVLLAGIHSGIFRVMDNGKVVEDKTPELLHSESQMEVSNKAIQPQQHKQNRKRKPNK